MMLRSNCAKNFDIFNGSIEWWSPQMGMTLRAKRTTLLGLLGTLKSQKSIRRLSKMLRINTSRKSTPTIITTNRSSGSTGPTMWTTYLCLDCRVRITATRRTNPTGRTARSTWIWNSSFSAARIPAAGAKFLGIILWSICATLPLYPTYTRHAQIRNDGSVIFDRNGFLYLF